MMRRIFWDYLRFFGPGFHPWHRDDRRLIAQIEKQLTLGPPPPAAA
jgi:predicted metal-dependent hydrolase